MSQVKEKDTVKVHYTGKLSNGQVFDSSLEREPLEFTLGEGMLIPGFEKAVIDMKVNDKKTVEIPVNEAYGEVREELFHKVDKAQLPQELEPQVGLGLVSKSEDGREHQFRIAEVNEDHIVVDGNHPLAGQDLVFDLELVEIK
ncbi:peptidylprolyl isomerase [Oceanihabitans sediminis]|uniref:Peptidyl-prolyl cis-trans isomerase n=1 Tax=Oceanihabitans sediminis TaxID=1812012 RepID=A0A368P2X2_9FLAO|nr:peptidylprolyl isomerase [Oceanihabitans sediminis]MDX1277389.1 peptidylprolyl isomerase [Oceanihabitans sediminis]MDX1774186.1 peptidylprolyl isomerase [Oceanihabitans sediminis]RBP30805.1 FKBP-type peptidyl-prolyl cis-trans isomerase 2 [Oceanihabitans sediminis]RCU56773.1 peptidylprolyl isomerase [Oceanihabitans sediminis]